MCMQHPKFCRAISFLFCNAQFCNALYTWRNSLLILLCLVRKPCTKKKIIVLNELLWYWCPVGRLTCCMVVYKARFNASFQINWILKSYVFPLFFKVVIVYIGGQILAVLPSTKTSKNPMLAKANTYLATVVS